MQNYYNASRPTARVSGGQGAGVDKSLRAEKTQSQKNACKSRRVPAVGCTLCWAAIHHRITAAETRFVQDVVARGQQYDW